MSTGELSGMNGGRAGRTQRDDGVTVVAVAEHPRAQLRGSLPLGACICVCIGIASTPGVGLMIDTADSRRNGGLFRPAAAALNRSGPAAVVAADARGGWPRLLLAAFFHGLQVAR